MTTTAETTRNRDWRDVLLAGLAVTAYLLMLIVSGSGWGGSFVGLHDFAREHMGLANGPAWFVPVTFDGAAAGLSLVVVTAALHGRAAGKWLLMIVGFTGLSSWINWVHIADHRGRVVSALLPIAAVLLFEALMSEVRAAYARRVGKEHARLHPLRWLFDFRGTLAIVRARVLEIELPTELAAAAEVVEQSKPRGKRRRKTAAKSTPKPAAAPADTVSTEAAETAPDGMPEAVTEQTVPMLRAVPAQGGDYLDAMNKDELRAEAKRVGETQQGTMREMRARIRQTETYARERARHDGDSESGTAMTADTRRSGDTGTDAGHTSGTADGHAGDDDRVHAGHAGSDTDQRAEDADGHMSDRVAVTV